MTPTDLTLVLCPQTPKERNRKAATGSLTSLVLLLQHLKPTEDNGLSDTVHEQFRWNNAPPSGFQTFVKALTPSPMASPVADIGQSHQHHPVTELAADSAFREAQKWIEVSDREPAQSSSVLCFLLAQVFVVVSCGLSYWFAACLCSSVSFKQSLDFIDSSPVDR